jgi:outer membrane protein OmpA-like peptidoglycan-associated protein
MRPCAFYVSSVLVLFATLGQSEQLNAQTYSASFNESEWSAKSGAFACSLSHTIPGFGSARFVRKTGGSEFLELKPDASIVLGGAMKIEAVPPVWRVDAAATSLGQVQVPQGQPLRVPATQISTISAVLEQGTNVVFGSTKMDANGNSLRVALEANRFKPAFDRYRACVGALIPYTFDQIARTLINYAPDAEDLSPSAKAQLDKILRYSKADPGVIGVLVDAHSDKLPTPEEGAAASQRQAELVTDYLIDKGMPANIITTRWHGDKFPIASNQNKAGQAKNRRITVRMENEATRKEMEKKIAAIIAAEEKAAVKKAAAEKAAQEHASSASSALPVNLQELEQLVEQQDLTSGKQPDAKKAQ